MVTIWSGLLDNSLVNDCGVTMLGPLSSTVAQVDGIPVFVPLRCLLLGQGMTQFYARIFFSSVCTESHVLRPLCGQGSLFQGSVGLSSGTLSGMITLLSPYSGFSFTGVMASILVQGFYWKETLTFHLLCLLQVWPPSVS